MSTRAVSALLTLTALAGCNREPQPAPAPIALTEPRLLGTWVSDADRTIEEARGPLNLTAEREAAFRKIFGRFRVTYSPTRCSTDFDGTTDSYEYRVLGSDATSVAIRSIDAKPNKLLNLSEFSVIYFDGPDALYLQPQLGPREYFKRVK